MFATYGVGIFFYNGDIKMPPMAAKCLYGNYLVVTIKYIRNNKCVYKKYFYHSSVIFTPLSISLSPTVLLGILNNTK